MRYTVIMNEDDLILYSSLSFTDNGVYQFTFILRTFILFPKGEINPIKRLFAVTMSGSIM